LGWLVWATTGSEHTGDEAEIVRADRDQTSTVEPGGRWRKHPAAISPVWLEKRERLAALAMLTGVGLLSYRLIHRHVRQDLQQQQAMPGNKGDTARPTAAVVLEAFPCVTQVQVDVDGVSICRVYGWQAHHQLVCQALALDESWYDRPVEQKNNRTAPEPLEHEQQRPSSLWGVTATSVRVRPHRG
jgi:hypothetical protein